MSQVRAPHEAPPAVRGVRGRSGTLGLCLDLLRRRGPAWALRAVLRRAALFAGWLLLLPAAIAGHLLGYRRLPVHTFVVGHLASEPDCFLKERALGRFGERRWLLLAPEGRVANPALLEVWSRHLRVVQHPVACAVLEAMTWRGPMRHGLDDYMNRPGHTQRLFEVYREWGRRAPLAALDEDTAGWGAAQLRMMGVPEGAWFACVHVRQPGFGRDFERIHEYRNADPLALLPAIAEIRRRGGWVIRMGDATMTPLPPIEGVIDYALAACKSPRMDVFLCARARFFLGNTSGLFLVSAAFGVPCALANMVPLASMAPGPDDLSIPKLQWCAAEQRLLTFPEIFTRGLANALRASAYSAAGIEARENSPEDILDLTLDMLDHLDRRDGCDRGAEHAAGHAAGHADRHADRHADDPADPHALARRFKELLQPGDYAWGAASTVSPRFLARHRALLEPASATHDAG